MLHILEQSAGAEVNSEADFEIALRVWASDLGLSINRLRCCIHELVQWFDKLRVASHTCSKSSYSQAANFLVSETLSQKLQISVGMRKEARVEARRAG